MAGFQVFTEFYVLQINVVSHIFRLRKWTYVYDISKIFFSHVFYLETLG